MASILFDLDGTLLDTAPDIYAAVKEFLSARDQPVPSYQQVRSLIGGGVRNMVTHLVVSGFLPPDDEQFEHLTSEFKDHYERATSETTIFPGVPEALDELIQQNHRLGVCTNKPSAMANALLEKLDIASRFNAVLGPESVPAKKPDPRHLYATLEALGGGAGIFIGDSIIDAEASAAASMPFILFRGGYLSDGYERLTATAEFDDFGRLPSIISGILASQ